MAWTLENDVYTVEFSELNDLLQSLPANTKATPYKLNITELTANDIVSSFTSGSLGYVIKNNNTKYIDLVLTELPNSVRNMYSCFENCTSLVTAPNIPNSVTSMGSCFIGCTSLEIAPNIPNSVTYMGICFEDCTSLITAPNIPNSVGDIHYCFAGCTSLTTVPNIPNSVTYMYSCFYNCTSLETIESWELTDLTNVTMTRCFSNCTSLREIKVSTPIVEDTEYKLWKIQTNATTNIAKVTVYNADGTVKLSETQVPYSANANLTITGKTDELGFAPVGSLTNELIEKMLSYKTQITGDTNRLNVDKKSFLMYAESPANFHSNIIFPDGITAECTTGASEENKVITLTKWTDTELPARCEIDVTFTHGNTYGETTASTPTYPKLVVKNATNTTIGTFDICDSRGHYAGKGFCNDGDLIIFKKVGNKVLITNSDIRQSTDNYKIYSDNYTDNGTAIRLKDYNSPNGATIRVGYEGAGLSEFNYFAGFAHNGENAYVLKDIKANAVSKKLGLRTDFSRLIKSGNNSWTATEDCFFIDMTIAQSVVEEYRTKVNGINVSTQDGLNGVHMFFASGYLKQGDIIAGSSRLKCWALK